MPTSYYTALKKLTKEMGQLGRIDELTWTVYKVILRHKEITYTFTIGPLQ